MMHRNLDRRVETLVRLVEPAQIAWLNDLFDMAMSPNFSSWELDSNGGWTRHLKAEDGSLLLDYQETLIARTRSAGTP
jgi:polyphosphate kinase